MNKLKAGRKLDVLVAKNVMGWTDLREEEYPETKNVVLRGDNPEKLEYRFAVPYFSTDISAAWKVLEKIQGTNALITIELAERARCMIFESWGRDKRVCTNADTAPLAICLAALKIVA